MALVAVPNSSRGANGLGSASAHIAPYVAVWRRLANAFICALITCRFCSTVASVLPGRQRSQLRSGPRRRRHRLALSGTVALARWRDPPHSCRCPGPPPGRRAGTGTHRRQHCRRGRLLTARHRHDIADAAPGKEPAELRVVPVRLVRGDPPRRHPGVQSPAQHPHGQHLPGDELVVAAPQRRCRAVSRCTPAPDRGGRTRLRCPGFAGGYEGCVPTPWAGS